MISTLLKMFPQPVLNNWAIPTLFSLFSSFQQLTVRMFIKKWHWWDLNRGPLISEATAVPTEPQIMPRLNYYWTINLNCKWTSIHNQLLKLSSIHFNTSWIKKGNFLILSGKTNCKRLPYCLLLFAKCWLNK